MSDHPSTCVVLCTCPDEATAGDIAKQVVAEKLAACVNILPKITSVYEWKEKVCEDDEVLLIIKTTEGAIDALSKAIVATHPYELPEIIAVPIKAGLPGYLDWVSNSVNV
ncbi:MAG: divalent-cation tolerance protein CutA [Salinisphaeraceae bacterium]|nr:divalent-cation tolerance protein CutA [Salinisphaeraceae bacterium]